MFIYNEHESKQPQTYCRQLIISTYIVLADSWNTSVFVVRKAPNWGLTHTYRLHVTVLVFALKVILFLQSFRRTTSCLWLDFSIKSL